jgi:hypothetical protein
LEQLYDFEKFSVPNKRFTLEQPIPELRKDGELYYHQPQNRIRSSYVDFESKPPKQIFGLQIRKIKMQDVASIGLGFHELVKMVC